MATVDPLQEDFLGQLLRALQQRSNFGKDITDEIGRTEAQLDTPNPFSQVFDLDERRSLQQGEQRRTQGVLNNLQDQLGQRNQAIGNVAESVNRGFQAARTQSNLDRDFRLRQQQLAQQQANADRTFRASQSGQEDNAFAREIELLLQTGKTRSQLASLFPSTVGALGPDANAALALESQDDDPTISEQLALDAAEAREREEVFNFVTALRQGDEKNKIAPVTSEKEIVDLVNSRFKKGTARKFGLGLASIGRAIEELIQIGTPEAKEQAKKIQAASGYTAAEVDRFLAKREKRERPATPLELQRARGPVTFDRNNRQITF